MFESIILFIIFYIIPGVSIYLIFYNEINKSYKHESAWLLIIVLGIFFNFILFHIFTIASMNLGTSILVQILFTVLSVIIIFFRIRALHKTERILENFKVDKVLLALLGILWFILIFRKGDLANDLHYLGMAVKNIQTGTWVNQGFYLDKEMYDPVMSFNPYGHLLTLLSYFSGGSFLRIWRNLPAIWAPVSVLAIYSAALKYFNNKNTARAAVMVMILHFGGIFFNIFGFSNFHRPLPVCMYVLIPFILIVFIDFIKKRNLIYGFLLGIGVSCLYMLNPLYVFFLYLGFFLYFLIQIPFSSRSKTKLLLKNLARLIYITIIISPIFIFKIISFNPLNRLYYDTQNISSNYFLINSALFFGDNYFIINPRHLFGLIHSIIGVDNFILSISPAIAAVGSLFLFFDKKVKRESSLILFGMVLVPVFFGLNPVVVPFLTKLLSLVYVQRLGVIIPVFLIEGYLLLKIIELLSIKLKKVKQFIVPVLLILIFGINYSHIVNNIKQTSRELQLRKTRYTNISVINQIMDAGLENKIIFSDPQLSYYIATLTNNLVYVIPALNSNINNPESLSREINYYKIIEEDNPEIVYDFMIRNQIDYMVLTPKEWNTGLDISNPVNLPQLYFYFYKNIEYGRIFKTVAGYEKFKPVWKNERFIIYEIKK